VTLEEEEGGGRGVNPIQVSHACTNMKHCFWSFGVKSGHCGAYSSEPTLTATLPSIRAILQYSMLMHPWSEKGTEDLRL